MAIDDDLHKMTVPVYGDLVYTSEGGTDWGYSLPQAVEFAKRRGAVLQSAREAAAHTIGNANEEAARNISSFLDGNQLTRTVALYFWDDWKPFVAFDDDVKGIIVKMAKEGAEQAARCKMEARKKYDCSLLFAPEDADVVASIARARESGRVVSLEGTDGYNGWYMLPLHATFRKSPFGKDSLVQAMLGDISETYAQALYSNGFKRDAMIHFLGPWKFQGNVVDARPVVLQAYKPSLDVHASLLDFSSASGVARGVYNPSAFKK